MFFNPQTEACDYPANVAGCKAEKKASKKKQQSSNKKQTTSTSKSTTEAPESTTRAASTTQRNNNYSSNLRRRTTTTTTTTQAPPTTSRSIAETNQQLTPELLAAALKLAREQETSSTVNAAGPSNDHLFQLLQLVKSLGGIDKVQELLNSYNYNKKPISLGSIDFATPMNADIHTHTHVHNRHLDNAAQPPAVLIDNNGPGNLLQPFGADYAAPQRQNTRGSNRQHAAATTISPFLNPSYVTPRRQIEPLAVHSPNNVDNFPNQPAVIIDASGNNDLMDIPRNTQPRQRRPAKIESTTEGIPLDQATSSRTRSPFSFVYNEPILRNPQQPNVQPANSIYENGDESLLAITESTRTHSNGNSRQRGRGSAVSTGLLIENNMREQTPRPRIRGSSRQTNNVARDNTGGHLRDQPATNVDGFFLYNQPTRSTRQPNAPSESLLNTQDKPPRRNQNSRSRQSETSIGNSYSVPARVTSLTSLNNNDPRSSETAPSSSSTRKRKPAKVRISTGFVVAETPASPGKPINEYSLNMQ